MEKEQKYKRYATKVWRFTWQTVLIVLMAMTIFEVIYRNYWIDFYRNDLVALNPQEDLNLSKEKTILVFGDSFSADPNGWVKTLRDSLPACNVINSALPGTSIFHQKIFFEDRIDEFQPDQIIIQLYVGNDLIDYYRPINFSKVSFFRNLYWSLSDRFISLQFINYRLGQIKSAESFVAAKLDACFSAEKYNPRVLTYLNADPTIISQSISPEGGMNDTMIELLSDLSEMISEVKVPVYLVVVPHCTQVSETYFDHYLQLGANLDRDKLTEYLFLKNINDFAAINPSVKVLDPLSYFKNQDNVSPLYFSNDPHLNSIGQEKLGQFILAYFD